MQQSTQQMVEQNSIPDYEVCYDPSNADTLVFLKNLNELIFKLSSYDVLPNFIVLPNPQKSNIHKLSLKAMIQQPVTKLMIKKFCDLARKCYDGMIVEQLQIDKFQKLMLTNFDQLNQKDRQIAVLKEYTKNSFFHSLLNSLLRSGTDAMELFYCHYFVQIMSKSIKQLYRTYDQGQRKLECYRGAYLSEQQKNNFKVLIGRHIEVLGFFSTSLNKAKAMQFAINALIQIVVEDQNRHYQFDYGYAFMQNISQNSSEQQVLFNAMCSFEVLSVTIQIVNKIQLLVIKLKYGCSSTILAKYNENHEFEFSKIQKQILPMLMYQSVLTFKQKIQGAIFPNFCQQQIEYLQTYINLTETCQNHSKKSLQYCIRMLITYYTVNNSESQRAKTFKVYLQKNKYVAKGYFYQIPFQLKQAIQSDSSDKRNQKIKDLILYMQKVYRQKKIYFDQNFNQCTQEIQEKNGRLLEIMVGQFIIIILKQFIKNQNLSDLLKELQKLKSDFGKHFGKFHPIYIFITQQQFQIGRVLGYYVSSQQHDNYYYQILKQINHYSLKQEQYFILYRQLITQNLQNNQFQQAASLYIQYKDKLFALYPPNSEELQIIQSDLLIPIITKIKSLCKQLEYSKCLILIQKFKNNTPQPYSSNLKNREQSILSTKRDLYQNCSKLFDIIANNFITVSYYQQALYIIEECNKAVKSSKIFGQDSQIYLRGLIILEDCLDKLQEQLLAVIYQQEY